MRSECNQSGKCVKSCAAIGAIATLALLTGGCASSGTKTAATDYSQTQGVQQAQSTAGFVRGSKGATDSLGGMIFAPSTQSPTFANVPTE